MCRTGYLCSMLFFAIKSKVLGAHRQIRAAIRPIQTRRNYDCSESVNKKQKQVTQGTINRRISIFVSWLIFSIVASIA